MLGGMELIVKYFHMKNFHFQLSEDKKTVKSNYKSLNMT